MKIKQRGRIREHLKSQILFVVLAVSARLSEETRKS
jgi:hypothetical protein